MTFLTRLFVARPTLVFVLIALMSFAGVVSLQHIVEQLFPNVEQPTITIFVQYNGASPTEMRDNIVEPIEDNLAGTTDLQTMNSVIQQGQATIAATFYLGSSVATDLALTEKAVQTAQRYLPTVVVPVVSIRDPSESVVITLEMSSTKLSAGQLSLYANNVIAPKIEQIPGISNVGIGGQVTPAYEVEIDPIKLAAHGLTLTDIINTVSGDNNRVPGGIVYEPNRETSVDVRGDVIDPNSIAQLPIGVSGSTASDPLPGGSTDAGSGGLTSLPGSVDPWTASNSVPRIADIGKVVPGNEPRRQWARINGHPALYLFIQKSSNSSEVVSAQNVIDALPLLQKQFPEVHFQIVNTVSKFSEQQIGIVLHTLVEAILLTGIAMVFFLRSWRNAVVVCVAIPTSLCIALTAMKLMNLTIDTISMLAMTLVIGILVDDSTVVLENIERHHAELHKPPDQAAIDGRAEIGVAAMVITLVDVVVFLPIAFLPGQVGQQLQEFGMVVVVSTLTSLFVSFTITPALAAKWSLRSHWKPPKVIDWFTHGFDGLRNTYAHRILPWALRHRTAVVAACLVSFVASVALVPLGVVGEEYLPATDRGEIFEQITFPLGTPLSQVRDATYKLENVIDRQPDIDGETTSAGAYSAAFGGFVVQGNVSQIHIFLKDDRKHSTYWWVTRLRQIAQQHLPSNAKAVIVPSTGQAAGNTQPIDYLVTDLTGGDPTQAATKVEDILRETPGAISVNSSGTALAPQVSIDFDRAKAQALNIDIGTAAVAAGAAFGGDQVTQFETPQGLEQVQVIYPLQDQTELQAIQNVPIRSRTGQIVHLSDIATIRETPTAPLITRTDRNTVIHVDANISPGASLSNVQRAFEKLLKKANLPNTISVRPAPLGQQDFMKQTLSGLGSSLILSVILVFLLMVALYNSYRSPFIILFSVPVAAVGAIGALVITHQTLNLFSLIGTVLLIGIATKNGILLVDYANTLRRRGRDKLGAIMESAFTRFRPIVMTSFSVVAGNLPLALALEPGSQARASLGIVVIGGVVSSLVLTLLLVPIMYIWVAPREVAQGETTAEGGEPSVNGRTAHPEPVGALSS